MSKERAAALNDLKKALVDDAADAPADAIVTLIGDGLNSLGRIAAALETLAKAPTIAPMGEGHIVGELAKFEPAIDPDLFKRGIEALEKLATPAPPQ